jgi:hypothetical protein
VAQEDVVSAVVLDTMLGVGSSRCWRSGVLKGGAYNFANTPLNEAHAPEAMAMGCHGI